MNDEAPEVEEFPLLTPEPGTLADRLSQLEQAP